VLAHTVARYDEAARNAWAQRIAAVREQGIEAVVDMVVGRYLHPSFRSAHPGQAAALRDQLLAMDASAYAASASAVAGVDWLDALPAIHVPALVIAGRHDLGAPPAECERIARAIHGSEYRVLEHSSHLSPIEEPHALVEALTTFLDSHGL
jgi:pimeloyl-ACP methyl ester carboxylesterase